MKKLIGPAIVMGILVAIGVAVLMLLRLLLPKRREPGFYLPRGGVDFYLPKVHSDLYVPKVGRRFYVPKPPKR